MVKKGGSTVEKGAVCLDPGAIEDPPSVHGVSEILLRMVNQSTSNR